MICHDKFVHNTVDVKKWLLTTFYSYETTRTVLSNKIKSGTLIEKEIDSAFDETKSNIFALIRRLSIDNLKTCKELAIIQCISALEEYLITAIKDIFLANKKPFLSNDTIEYHLGEVLSCKDIEELHLSFIEKKCRQLHSMGFSEVGKYYKKIFGIDFRNYNSHIEGYSIGINKIEEYHDIRHLIIHKLGNTDDAFRKKYKTDITSITLSQNDMFLFFKILINFSNYINNKLSQFILTTPSENSIEITIKLKSQKDLSFLDPTFLIPVNKNIGIQLSQILETIKYDDDSIVIILRGDMPIIRKYYKILLTKVSAGELLIKSYIVLSLNTNKKTVKQFRWSDIEKVMNELPEKPWKKHMHKEIAKILGWSNNKVQRIIDLILSEQQTTLTLNRQSVELKIGEVFELEATITPIEMNYKSITWTAYNPEVVSIDNGHIVALSSGITKVLARITNECIRARCTISVIDK